VSGVLFDKGMKAPTITLLCLLLTISHVAAQQAGFRYHVSNRFRTAKLDYERIQQIEVGANGDGSADLSFREYFHVYGVNQPVFAHRPTRYSVRISAKAYRKFLDEIAKLDPKRLSKETANQSVFVWGTLNIEDAEFRILATADSPERKPWEDVFAALRKEFPPNPNARQAAIEIEGDIKQPAIVKFTDLLKRPEKYDGKRVRTIGFWHCEFEGSSFSRTKEENDDYERAFWLGGSSSFADKKMIDEVNDAYVVVEGTFDTHSSGHMGLWKASLSRITSIRIAKEEEIEGVNSRPAPDVKPESE